MPPITVENYEEIFEELGNPHTVRNFPEASAVAYYWKVSPRVWILLRVVGEGCEQYSELELILRSKASE